MLVCHEQVCWQKPEPKHWPSRRQNTRPKCVLAGWRDASKHLGKAPAVALLLLLLLLLQRRRPRQLQLLPQSVLCEVAN